jgi:peroxiredoxin
MNRIAPLLFASLTVLCLTPAFGQKLSSFGIDTTQTVPEGLAVNSYAPLFNLTDSDGNEIDFGMKLKQSKMVVVFVRGQWSRHCRKYVERLQDSLAVISNTSTQVVVVSPEKPEFLERWNKTAGPDLRIVSDQYGQVARDYNLAYKLTSAFNRRIRVFRGVSLEARNGNDQNELPVTAVYVVSQSGKITYRYFNYDYRQRPPVSELMEALK